MFFNCFLTVNFIYLNGYLTVKQGFTEVGGKKTEEDQHQRKRVAHRRTSRRKRTVLNADQLDTLHHTQKRQGGVATQTVKCVCGEELLFLPDYKAMGKAIETHIRKRHSNGKGPLKYAERFRARQHLAVEVLRLAIQQQEAKS